MHSTSVQKFILVLLALSFLSASGCYVRNKLLVEPKTGQTADCSSWGVGWLGAPMAAISSSNCIDKYREMGYVDSVQGAVAAAEKPYPPPDNSKMMPFVAPPPTPETNKETFKIDRAEETLRKLKALHAEGILTDREFESKKAETLKNF